MIFFTKTAQYLLCSFLVSVAVYTISTAMLSDNFAQTLFPQAKHLVSHHLWQSLKTVTASSPDWPQDPDGENGLFLFIWAFLFLYLMFFQLLSLLLLTDADYVLPAKALDYRKGGSETDG